MAAAGRQPGVCGGGGGGGEQPTPGHVGAWPQQTLDPKTPPTPLPHAARIRPVPLLRVSFPPQRSPEDSGSREALEAVLGGRPLVCLAFEQVGGLCGGGSRVEG